MKEFKDRRGQLTAYALACGYLELVDNGVHRIKLGRHSGQTIEPYFVDVYGDSGLIYGEQYQTLAQARKSYRNALKSYA